MKLKTFGFPHIFNIEADPKEMVSIAHSGAGWVMGFFLQLVGKYMKTEETPESACSNVTNSNHCND